MENIVSTKTNACVRGVLSLVIVSVLSSCAFGWQIPATPQAPDPQTVTVAKLGNVYWIAKGDTCKDCNGTGKHTCQMCNGIDQTTLPCAYCGGIDQTTLPCDLCHGVDQTQLACVVCQGIDQTSVVCSHCNGIDQTSLACAECQGTGSLPDNHRCFWCSGTGHKSACFMCGGTGHKPVCVICHGSGKRSVCVGCYGTGHRSACFLCYGSGRRRPCALCGGRPTPDAVCEVCNGAKYVEVVTTFRATREEFAQSIFASQNDQANAAHGKPVLVVDLHGNYIAENGSYYGQISSDTGRPRVVFVNGYFRKDGTYVRSHYRSLPLGAVTARGPPYFVYTSDNDNTAIQPRVAENGSYYGQLNDAGVPKTVHVRGYYHKDGTYVRGHYRSKPRR